MLVYAARLRSFTSPRITLVLLLLGFSGQWLVRRHVGATAAQNAQAIASVDSAIARALPSPTDTSADSGEQLRRLTSRKRDLEIEADRIPERWFYAFALSNGLILAATVTGAQALVSHLRDSK